jgi:hypothetical protein
MSNYGPPYGQPSDPWGGQGGGEPWGGQPPSAPPGGQGSDGGYGVYGGQTRGYEPGYGQGGPGYGEPGYGSGTGYGQPPSYGPGYDQGYGQQPPYDPNYGGGGWQPAVPTPPRRKRGMGPVLALVVTLAVLVCGGTGVALWLVGRDDNPNTNAGATNSPSAAPSATPSAARQSATPDPASATDARFVKKGQCVKNVGTAATPKLAITKCAPKTYEVLARFDTATTGKDDAQKKCKDVQGYTDWYFFNSPLDLNDYVLCLKLR